MMMCNDVVVFVAYSGIPPESTCSRTQTYLLQLYGMFRLLPRDVKRIDAALLLAIRARVTSHQSVDEYLRRC